MAKFNKPFITSLFIVAVIMGCGNGEDASPYGDLLSRPPYSRLTDSIHKIPSDPDLYYRRGMLLFKNNNNPPALVDFRKAWSINKKEIYAINIGNILLDEKPDSAILFLQDALKTLPSSIALHISLIQAYADLQKTDEALNICNAVLAQYPGQVGVLMIKSDLLDQKGDTTGALKSLEQAYVFAPANEELCYNLAFKYAQNKNARALNLCDSLLHNDTISKKAEPYYFKGVYYSNVNDKTKALDYFDKAIEFDYTFLDAHMDKGQILFDEKRYVDASKVFQLVMKISAAYADAYYWLGKCQEAQGQKDEAKLNYQRAYGLDKSLTEAKEAADRL
ncbi:MAG TPA: tetratricopeptide repeat protein [Chitinophagaceae bacterium]